MPDTLRERIEQALRNAKVRDEGDAETPPGTYKLGGVLAPHELYAAMDAILPVVEQAIREEREKAERWERSTEMWERTAHDMANNWEFYRGMLIRCGQVFGVEARTADDGNINEDVLTTKVPELVEAQALALAEKDAQIAALQAEWAKRYEWALARLHETPAPPQTQEHLSGVNDDYYLPGKKAGG